MSISIIELWNEGKRGTPDLCEDLYVANKHFVAVIDGATNVTGQLMDGKTPGRLAAEVIQTSLLEADEDITLSQLLEKINHNLLVVYERLNLLAEIQENAWMAPSACLICYSHFYREIWQIGDSQCMIDGTLYKNDKIIDDITGKARALYLEAEIKKGKTIDDLLEHDTGWEFIRPLIKQQYQLQNAPDNQFGYEVINGFPVDESKIQIIPVPDQAKTIILSSDGYPVLYPTLEESEKELKTLLEKDPLCFREYIASKGLQKGNLSFDDRTYIRFDVE
ncbi:hypothetical protein ACFFF5_06560 [Lederbergia wuyishanensis]|uniref:Glycerophosphoryl diester phosphodiesterase n=1 Tax=Lederbergia wuyishanensis TaxID=1347903 RepID=A0ABU0D2U9_9BACI|nr:hypothetical protein [Lederbergia wuyishanensis]MCJ8007152.1 hypothetical protein [Lederbergia wuyishanensis]MDQ0342703.1 glycerophosphoryl diester phosphodiesterase [Lederbergia wuyishanensis]